MTVRPMNFRDFQVRAMLEGRKTQDRRVLKPQPHEGDFFGFMADENKPGRLWGLWLDPESRVLLPYAPGDLLWVREVWKPGAWREDGRVAVDYRASPEETQTPWITLPDNTDWDDLEWRWSEEARKADCPMDDCGYYHWQPGQSPLRWRSPIHMPRWASRLTLRVTDVRVQRVQEMDRGDAMEEGCPFANMAKGPNPRDWFADLWNTLHKPPHDWSGNPWVRTLTFDVIRKNVDEVKP